MALSVIIAEEDLRSMPPELREQLLRWYFDGRPAKGVAQPSVHTQTHHEPDKRCGLEDPTTDARRVSFADLVNAGLLRPGQEIRCRTLKRQQRKGSEQFIGGARVVPNGTVEFEGKTYSTPSKLAKVMVNANGGKAEALNGYDYLFVQTPKGFVRLSELRDGMIGATPAERAEVDTLMETGAFADESEALRYVRQDRLRS